MVCWDVANCEAAVFRKKICNSRAFVPTGLINPELDTDLFVSIQYFPEHAQKAISVPFFLLHHPMLSTHWVDPTEDVETLAMLALGQNKWLSSLFAPNSAKLRMETKPRLIREQDHALALTPLDCQEFFMLSGNSSTPSMLA